ncbi:hypothetical protein BU24DRAFT_423650 [Aaosphaeria arxii CBS 175.79]|uniref:Protein BIG1 n=1 Tax=Aaosphaeria arxii CBS 175.79 TaxID=1450172 RepID=A0A6A5XN95_9PLEO|nr:uncharacterized protein BU24DRAFT_423650 [Aaosphaeria arxii CBS 175.79]KAF2014745.1 hypothetical protein BU24DRAFT_423650 [Aaosphaeria arxii CBS 175.79]
MAKTLVGALALASLPSALAFRNTSPFFLLSTSDLKLDGSIAHFAQSGAISAQLQTNLKECPSEAYFLVRHEGISSADYHGDTAGRPDALLRDSPHDIKSTMQIPEVVGDLKIQSIAQSLQQQCGARLVKLDPEMKESDFNQALSSDDTPPRVYEITFSEPSEDSNLKLSTSNAFISSAISQLAPHGKFTLIYTTTPPTKKPVVSHQPAYEMEDPFGDAVQMELKRDLSLHGRANNDGSQDDGGLFERYQYLSPGLFMGISAMIPLVLILLVGLRAISNLEVSYFAFSKEMGPAAQRKQ